MKKAMLGWLAVAVVAFTAPSAWAQNDITLGASQSGFLSFVAEGSGNFSLNLCTNRNSQFKCASGDTMTGQASGQGVFGGNGYFYILTGTNTLQGDLVGCSGTGSSQVCSWNITGGPWNFDLNSRRSGGGINFLQGTLMLTSFKETPQKTGQLFTENMTFQLTITGGTLATLFQTTGGVVVFNVQTDTTKSLSATKAGLGVMGVILDGSVTPTPEPGTMALVGSGLVLLGGLLRRKFGA